MMRSVLIALALLAASIAPAAAQYVPQGSYQQSCVDIRSDGNMLRARCTAPNGQLIFSQFQIGSCRGGDIANRNGYLACNNQNGYNPGPGPNWRLPAGSYQQSCRNLSAYQGVLSGQCTASNGAWIRSSLQWYRCVPGADIANINGRLECLAYR
jgi:hypothetical protein